MKTIGLMAACSYHSSPRCTYPAAAEFETRLHGVQGAEWHVVCRACRTFQQDKITEGWPLRDYHEHRYNYKSKNWFNDTPTIPTLHPAGATRRTAGP